MSLIAFDNALAGLLVGFMIGLTGIGGGALMTPLLILLLGVPAKTAIATDLLFAAITKSCGAGIHLRKQAIDWVVVRRLATGSLPAAGITGWWVHQQPAAGDVTWLLPLLGSLLMLTALGLVAKPQLYAWARRQRITQEARFKALQPMLTVLLGVLLGIVVTLTSVGAGALGAAFMLALYPLRLNGPHLVATDIVHAVPLALVASIGYLGSQSINWSLLAQLLVGSIPGVLIGSLLVHRLPERLIQWLLATVLTASAWKLIIR